MKVAQQFFSNARRLLPRRMSSTHVEKTADSSRDNVFSEVTVTAISQLSPTVKGFTLQVSNSDIDFSPGQWVDLHIPGEDIVGGYSIVSPPHQLKETQSIELAIKHNNHPPTLWMTTKCAVGDQLKVRVGGDFHYPSHRALSDVLLIGGGVGINPLLSMLFHHSQLLSSADTTGKGSARLLYSSKTRAELLFKDRIQRLVSEQDRVKVQYFVTAEECNSELVKCGRISAQDVAAALEGVEREGLSCFLCGPPPMTEAMIEILVRNCGLEQQQIHYEKWW